MKKYLVIGNPIEHSLSPKLHSYWLKQNNIDAVYDKKKLEENELKNIISQLKEEKINGINVTVPFKKRVIPYLDDLSPEAKDTQSVNTIYLQNGITAFLNGTVTLIPFIFSSLTSEMIFFNSFSSSFFLS